MNTEILGVVLQIFLLVVISYPLGKYIAKVYKGEKTWSDFMKPVERLIFKVAGVNPNEEMNWKQFLKALLILNAFWFVWGMVLLVSQGWLPLNPDGNGPQTPDQAFNTCISFMVNCNLQHYSGDAVRRDFVVERQKKIDADHEVEIPDVRPRGAGENLIKARKQRFGIDGLVIDENLQWAEQKTEHDERDEHARNVLCEAFFHRDGTLRV